MSEDTIAAIATAAGAAGVAVVRISGPDAHGIARKMFSPSRKDARFEPYRMVPGEIDCGEIRDYGLLVCFFAPRSFTGEDVAEFHCHGGAAIPRAVLRRAAALGARPAERGEFTRRAFLNGKLSLASCEGLAEMIGSESAAEARAGYGLYREKLTRRVRGMQDELKYAVAAIEAAIDFPEEGLEETGEETARRAAEHILPELERLLASYRVGRLVGSGVRVALVGAPNAGKSSLFNALLGFDRSIVTALPGTTRDVVDGAAEIGGFRFVFSDTAGLRDAADEAEALGVERSKREAESADVVLRVVDCSALCGGKDGAKGGGASGGDAREIVVYNKCDLAPAPEGEIAVSAATGEGLDALRAALCRKAELDSLGADAEFLLEERHFEALTRARKCLSAAAEAIGSVPADMLAIDLGRAWSALGEVTGETASEAVVDEIFSRFCVGK